MSLHGSSEQVIIPNGEQPWRASRKFTRAYGLIPAVGNVYHTQDAPQESLDILRKRPKGAVEIYKTTNRNVYRCGYFVLKITHERENPERWNRINGLAALAINVGLQEGLNEDSRLENGLKVVSPHYYAVALFPSLGVARWVMSYEEGNKVDRTNAHMVSTQEDRAKVYDAALMNSGINPAAARYDDGNHNLLLRPDTQELVKLDALSSWCHSRLLNEAA